VTMTGVDAVAQDATQPRESGFLSKTPRYLCVLGVGEGAGAHPVWPDLHQPFEGEVDADGSWCAWRLIGANHWEVGRSSRVFPDFAGTCEDAATLRDRIHDAAIDVLTVPRARSWAWQLHVDGVAVATWSRAFARHRECTHNASTFVAAAGTPTCRPCGSPVRADIRTLRCEREA
jgi:hypothetical protein